MAYSEFERDMGGIIGYLQTIEHMPSAIQNTIDMLLIDHDLPSEVRAELRSARQSCKIMAEKIQGTFARFDHALAPIREREKTKN